MAKTQLNVRVDEATAETARERASQRGISIAPGPLFSLGDKYRNNIRLSSACWDERIEQGIRTLGELAYELDSA